jgi:hypothetical protein
MARHRLRRAAHYVKRHHGKVTSGAKGTAVAAAVGAASYFLLQKVSENSEFVRTKWWAPAGVAVIGGHFIKRRYPTIGNAMIAVGGYVGGLTYAINNQAQATAKGYLDGGGAGALTSSHDVAGYLDAGGLTNPGDVAAYDVSEAGMLEG